VEKGTLWGRFSGNGSVNYIGHAVASQKIVSSAEFVGNRRCPNGLMENAASVEIRKSADSHRRLEKSRDKAAQLSHIFHGSYYFFSFSEA